MKHKKIRSFRNYIKHIIRQHLSTHSSICIRDVEAITGFYLDSNLFQDICRSLGLSSSSS